MIILKKRFRFKEGVTKVIYFHQEFFKKSAQPGLLKIVIAFSISDFKSVFRNNLRKNEAFGIVMLNHTLHGQKQLKDPPAPLELQAPPPQGFQI